MRVSQRFAGYSLAEADNLRKACGKKDRAIMAKERAVFESGCERSGYGLVNCAIHKWRVNPRHSAVTGLPILAKRNTRG